MVISQVYGAGGEAGSLWHNDFVELFNRSPNPVNLNNWTLQYANTASYTWQSIVLSGSLPPGRYYLIQLDSGAAGGAPMPAPDASGTILLHSTLGKVALMQSRTRISGLCPATGSTVDFVGYGAAASCFEGSAPTANLGLLTSAVRGAGGCQDTDNNASDLSVTNASAPGPRNSASPFNSCSAPTPSPTPSPSPTPAGASVVISQVYSSSGGAGSPWKNDYIELFNRGSSPASLTGWSVQYANTASATWQKTALSGVLQPGQYYLVKQSSGGANGAVLPPADAANTFLMNETLGKVALVSSTASLAGLCPTGGPLVDFVGYGSAVTCKEGSSPTADLANPLAAVRNAGGCQDTNQNGSDFTVTGAGAPGPRNSLSPLNVCSGSSVAAPTGALQPVELSGTVDSLPGGWALGAMSLAIAAIALLRRAGAGATR